MMKDSKASPCSQEISESFSKIMGHIRELSYGGIQIISIKAYFKRGWNGSLYFLYSSSVRVKENKSKFLKKLQGLGASKEVSFQEPLSLFTPKAKQGQTPKRSTVCSKSKKLANFSELFDNQLRVSEEEKESSEEAENNLEEVNEEEWMREKEQTQTPEYKLKGKGCESPKETRELNTAASRKMSIRDFEEMNLEGRSEFNKNGENPLETPENRKESGNQRKVSQLKLAQGPKEISKLRRMETNESSASLKSPKIKAKGEQFVSSNTKETKEASQEVLQIQRNLANLNPTTTVLFVLFVLVKLPSI